MPLPGRPLEKTKGGIASGGIANQCGSENLDRTMFYKNNDFTDGPEVPGKPA